MNLDGTMSRVLASEVKPGAVLRMVGKEGQVCPFSDFLVLSVKSNGNEIMVQMERPYAFVSGAGTTSPTLLMGSEKLEVSLKRLIEKDSLFRAVMKTDRTGKDGIGPYEMTT